MSDKVREVKDQRGLFEKVASYIPGYHGYKEKEIRRETDRLVRSTAVGFLAKAVDEIRRPLSSLSLSSSDREGADHLIARMDTVKQRTARAVAGYAGIFDAVKVKEPKLDKLMELDQSLVESSKLLYDACKALNASPVTVESFRIGASTATEKVEEIEGILDERNAMLVNP